MSIPPATGNTSLHYEGILVDKVGAASGAITPDGVLDAVFTLNLDIGAGVGRVLSYIDLVGPSATRSTRAGVGTALGVAANAGSALLNSANGTVGFGITSGAQLTLFASDGGFIVPGGSYTATAAFTDGSTFVGIFTIVPPAGAGTSASTLSVEISTIVSSTSTESPSCLCHSSTVPSATESPIAGITTCTVLVTAICSGQL